MKALPSPATTHFAHVLAMMLVTLRQRLKAAHSFNRVFHLNPPPCERLIVGDILPWQAVAARDVVLNSCGCSPVIPTMAVSTQHPQPLQNVIIYFSDAQVCHDFVTSLRWPNGVACPRCGSVEHSFNFHAPDLEVERL